MVNPTTEEIDGKSVDTAIVLSTVLTKLIVDRILALNCMQSALKELDPNDSIGKYISNWKNSEKES